MSASREKKLRQNSTKPVSGEQKKKSNLGKWLIGAVCILLCLVFAGASLLLNSAWPHSTFTAATVGEEKLTAGDLNYFYRQAYSTMSENLGESSNMISFFTDSIMEQALVYAQETYAAYFAAVDAGYTLTEEEQTELNETMESFDTVAPMMGYKNGDQYIAAVYGKGCNMDNFRQYNEVIYIVQRYWEDQLENYTASDDEKNAYYTEHKDEVDLLTYRQFYITVDEEAGMTLEKAQTEGERMRAEAEKDPTTFTTNAYELAPESNKTQYEEDTGTILRDIKPSLLTEEYVDPSVAAWLKDEARKEGDTATFTKANNAGVYVLYFIERDTHDYTSRNIRLIQVSVDSEDEADWNTAKEKVQTHLDTYLAGEQTPEAFGALADSHSTKGIVGGLHENAGKATLITALSDWLYDEARKEGDVELVQGSDGWYVALYCGEGQRYWDAKMDSVMDTQYYNTHLEELTETYPVERYDRGLKYVTTSLSTSY